MRKKLMIFLFSLLYTFAFSQNNYENTIKKDLNSFVQNMKSKDMGKAVEYIYPKYFTVVPKEQMKQILNFTYNNPAFKTTILDFKIIDIDKPEKINSELFSFANYGFKMNLKIDWTSFPNSQQLKTQISDGLYKKFGKENVTYFSKEDYYVINAKMKACAVSHDGINWKFVIIEKDYKPQLVKVLPKKILDKF
ncbi:hypothetical protein [Chryseobacterium sp. FH1]|uniref:hypothetical protein n=1 Tax=Chryseobacterium sp. FH1 TaxID=1233951 RepID=UPI0004E398EB|nr:hypothetical protein [Chryseobacterium sp. FH1]KFC22911.1 hypothetical protein IO90_04955 [Chryseobacterium sp. FH1]